MEKIEFVEDCKRIQSVLLSKGWEISLKESQDIWEERSGTWDACWLNLPEDDEEIISQINQYTKKYII